MLHKTRGIVFKFIRYRETSIIVTIFTELFGLQSYIINGVRSSKSSGNKMALFQPLTLLDMVVYHREHAAINRVREVKCLYHYHTLATDIKKSALAIFINEIINKSIKEGSDAQEVFEFLYHSFLHLDNRQTGYENFHLIFLLKLSRYLGFGAYKADEVLGQQVVSRGEEQLLDALLGADYITSVAVSNQQRRTLLDILLKFYARHIDSLGEIKSVQVLREIFI